jgi:hypothetical protein
MPSGKNLTEYVSLGFTEVLVGDKTRKQQIRSVGERRKIIRREKLMVQLWSTYDPTMIHESFSPAPKLLLVVTRVALTAVTRVQIPSGTPAFKMTSAIPRNWKAPFPDYRSGIRIAFR